jgi:hypothetical protein
MSLHRPCRQSLTLADPHLNRTHHEFSQNLGTWEACKQILKSYLAKTETIASKIRNEAKVSTVSTLIWHCAGIPSQSNKTGERNSRDSNRERRSEIVKLIQEKIGNTLDHISIADNFMNGTPVVKQLREHIDKWDYMKQKCF